MSQTQTETTLPKADRTEIIAIDDEDLEDGEIDDSDEEANDNDVVIVTTNTTATDEQKTSKKQAQKLSDTTGKFVNAATTDSVVTVIDSSSDTAATPPPTLTNKPKTLSPVDDDYAGSIENALANALKKKGVEPPALKVLDNKLQTNNDDEPGPGQGQSKSSRRRKRKKQREEKEKEKERKEKKKRYDTSDPLAPPPFDDEDDMDDYEMLNVRGGSPPPMTALPQAATQSMHMYKDPYNNSGSETGSSYDSYDSDCDDSNDERRRRKRRKESRKRKDKRLRDDDKRHDKRGRRDSPDHRSEPRKLELCKFYLLECCAKKDKCSYMHADFPCKYYYLGMECAQKEECKFSHGAPLSEELRNILLKHLETAPKEILGNFKRMTRENALALVTKRHEELCRTFNIQNVWAPCTASSLPIHSNHRRNNNNNNNNKNSNNNDQQHQLQQMQQQQQQNNNNIPSLLDLVLNPPPNMENKANSSSKSSENKRKSRWADNTNSSSHASSNNSNNNPLNIEPPSKTAPSYLDLKNLTGILSAEHIEKLSQLGIVNLEQVNQLTFGQLNQIGLTIAEITEIQLNAMNMAKLGVPGVGGGSSSTVSSSKSLFKVKKDNESSSAVNKDTSSAANGDIDMRLIPSAQPLTGSPTTGEGPDKDVLTPSSSNSNSGGVVMVDYSQYLRDSNLSFDRGDIYDDEKDDEKLVIDDDDDNTDNEEHNPKSSNSEQQQEEKNRSESFDNGFATKFQSMTDVTQTLRNPFRSAELYSSDKLDLRDPRSGKPQNIRNTLEKAVDNFYSSSAAPSKRKSSRDSRSRSRTPTRSQSNTPEASQSPQPLQMLNEQLPCKDVVYERPSMYDYSSRYAEEDEQRALKTKIDKDMRFLPGILGADAASSDIDLRCLPFQPMTNYTPATEIDGSITSHLPIMYKVYEVEVPRSSYVDLRQHFKSEQATDPRLRRIFGLPELSQSKTSAALSRKARKTSHSSIASPSESEDASPKYYTPPSAAEDRLKPSHQSRGGDPRGDPRAERENSKKDGRSDARADPRSDPRSDPRADPRRTDPRSAVTSSTSSSTSNTVTSPNATGGQKQNIEIRNLLQKSEWYKNLNSKFKIMVNQQLALVSTELKKFHQNSSPTKIFDISFIVNNQTLQQILTNLGIFIDDNGEVAHIDNENEELTDSLQDFGANPKSNVNLPNLSQPPPNVGGGIKQNNPALDYLRAPPPNMVPQGPPPTMALGPMFQRPPMQGSPFARPSLLGLPPGAQGNPLNPFANAMPNMNVNLNPNFMGAGPPNILGPFGPNFVPGMGMPPNMLQRNFNNNNNQRNNQRNQNRRKI